MKNTGMTLIDVLISILLISITLVATTPMEKYSFQLLAKAIAMDKALANKSQ